MKRSFIVLYNINTQSASSNKLCTEAAMNIFLVSMIVCFVVFLSYCIREIAQGEESPVLKVIMFISVIFIIGLSAVIT